MSNGDPGFGYQGRREGAQAAKDLLEGKITKEEFREKYGLAKDAGQGEEFKEGYASQVSEELAELD